eukprot:CAMPEP_0182416860 /NCGR_PEP_ID=MMETSP1167-20130531/1244_1 /TAXON_ID=2988 /ORGANISM="Mallomonas Sp, Strain CCMP3275" /LENGTH=135 /DNA_ID=CAMNT_0024589989 /DNA_START=100 /DNA_END=504 /DNA_ORIENTATION=+
MGKNDAESKVEEDNSIGNSQLLTKPAQKFPTPSPGNGDRVFYETLLKQRPDSEMAQDWCLAYGILSITEATVLQQKINKRKQTKQSPAKAKPAQSSKTSVTANKSKTSRRRKRDDDDDDDDDEAFDTGLDDGTVW